MSTKVHILLQKVLLYYKHSYIVNILLEIGLLSKHYYKYDCQIKTLILLQLWLYIVSYCDKYIYKLTVTIQYENSNHFKNTK